MDEVFATYMIEDIDFPASSKEKRGERLVAPPAVTMAKAALYVAMRKAGISKMQRAKQLVVDEKEVRRMLDPHYRLPANRYAAKPRLAIATGNVKPDPILK